MEQLRQPFDMLLFFRYKTYFYGTYETATLKNEDIWIYTAENKEKFASKV